MWLAIAVVGICFWLFKSEPKPILGIYNQPGNEKIVLLLQTKVTFIVSYTGRWFYLKAAFIYLSIQLRKYQAKRDQGNKVTNSNAGYGVKCDTDVGEMEKAQPLKDNPLAIDAVSNKRSLEGPSGYARVSGPL